MADNRRRFRWLVALALLGFAMWFLLDALEATTERAERQGVRLMLNQVRSALVVRGAEATLVRDETLESLEGLNPLSLLKREEDEAWPQEHCSALAPDDRGWCFDIGQRWLVYQPAQSLVIEGRQRGNGERFIWQVRVDYAGTVKNGKNTGKRATGLKLVEIDSDQVSETD
mgnify:CR=1 FL=1